MFVIKLLIARLTFNNNFNAIHQGIPVGGYTKVVVNMLKSIEVRFGVDYLKHHRAEPVKLAEIVVCNSSIDA